MCANVSCICTVTSILYTLYYITNPDITSELKNLTLCFALKTSIIMIVCATVNILDEGGSEVHIHVQARDDRTLFCDIYNVFLMFLIDFFVLNSNPMSASLKNLSIFVDSRSKVKLKFKHAFSRNEARNKCNTSFLCNFERAIHF